MNAWTGVSSSTPTVGNHQLCLVRITRSTRVISRGQGTSEVVLDIYSLLLPYFGSGLRVARPATQYPEVFKFHLVGVPGSRVAFVSYTTTASDLAEGGYTLTHIPVAASGRQLGLRAAADLGIQLPRAGMQAANLMWSAFGPTALPVRAKSCKPRACRLQPMR